MWTSTEERVDHRLLGTTVRVVVGARSKRRAGHGAEAALDTMRRHMDTFNVFDPFSELCQWRANPSQPASTDLLAVIDLARGWQAATNGAFSPFVDHLSDLWRHSAEQGHVPEPAQLSARLHDLGAPEPPWGALNLNAIAKGWIADRAVEVAMGERGVAYAWVDAGGDIAHRGNRPMVVGIERPDRPYDNEPPIARVALRDSAIATSGISRRAWTIDGQNYGHLIDPRTGQPVQSTHAVSVVAPDAATADALATALALMDPAHGIELIDTLAGVECLIVDQDVRIRVSSNWHTTAASSRSSR